MHTYDYVEGPVYGIQGLLCGKDPVTFGTGFPFIRQLLSSWLNGYGVRCLGEDCLLWQKPQLVAGGGWLGAVIISVKPSAVSSCPRVQRPPARETSDGAPRIRAKPGGSDVGRAGSGGCAVLAGGSPGGPSRLLALPGGLVMRAKLLRHNMI